MENKNISLLEFAKNFSNTPQYPYQSKLMELMENGIPKGAFDTVISRPVTPRPQIPIQFLSTPQGKSLYEELMIKALNDGVAMSETKVVNGSPTWTIIDDPIMEHKREEIQNKLLDNVVAKQDKQIEDLVIETANDPSKLDQLYSLINASRCGVDKIDCIFIKQEHLPKLMELCTHKEEINKDIPYLGRLYGIPLNTYKDQRDIHNYIVDFVRKKQQEDFRYHGEMYIPTDQTLSYLPKIVVCE